MEFRRKNKNDAHSKPRVMVIGSVGYGGIARIRGMYKLLEDNGFEVVNHNGETDYSGMQDFRSEKEMAKNIIESDMKHVAKADILVVLTNTPSWGTAIEMFYGSTQGKKVVLMAKDQIPTPWPIYYSNYIVESEDELIQTLKSIKIDVK